METAPAVEPGGLRREVGLAEFTTWKVGGPADWFAEPGSEEELIALAAWARCEGMPFRCIGAGSNLLIHDGGLEGLTAGGDGHGSGFPAQTLPADGSTARLQAVLHCRPDGPGPQRSRS